jgi:hypothetical protein
VIDYRTGGNLDLEVVRELYRASTLAERRPVEDRDRFAAMLRNANLVITAWENALLVGISRAVSDFSYATYLSDLAVRVSHQRQGSRPRIDSAARKAAAPQATLILLAAPAAQEYYPYIGFTHHPQAWVLRAKDRID